MTIDENALKKDVAEIFAKDIDISVDNSKSVQPTDKLRTVIKNNRYSKQKKSAIITVLLK